MVYLTLLLDSLPGKLNDLMHTPAMSMLDIMDGDGHINIDRLHDAAYAAMKDNVDVSIPVAGRFVFSRNDVDKLCDMIRRA